jgi:diguanylate cyclase (GGDEF)-like protein
MKWIEKLGNWLAVILFVLITATLTLFLYDFYSIITKSTAREAEEHLLQNSRVSASLIREKIQTDLDAIYALSSLISGFETIDSPEAKAMLKKVGNEFPFSALMVSTMDGKYYTNNESEINIHDPRYLVGTTDSDKRISVIYKNALYDRDMIALESPVNKNGMTVGMVSGLYYTNYINNVLDDSASGSGHHYQIVDRNGDFILSSGLSDFYKYKNLNRFMDSVSFTKEGGASKITSDIRGKKPGTSSLIKDGDAVYISYIPIGINDWYLFTMAPDTGINLQTFNMQNPTVTLAIRIVVLFIILILYIIWRQIRYRVTMEDTNQELAVLNERLQVKNESLKLKAENDLLTGLYNKMTSELAISEYLSNEGKAGRHALFIIDLDNFKGINDELGHFYGDKALTEVADAIDHCLRTTDIKGRFGGDEFIVLLKNITTNEDATQKAAEICYWLKKIKLSKDIHWKVSGTIGISIYPYHAENFNDLFVMADKAMYYAKGLEKGSYYIYDSKADN